MKLHAGDCPVQLSNKEWDALAEKTEGYTGSDIATVVLGALFQPIRHLQTSQYWKYTSGWSVLLLLFHNDIPAKCHDGAIRMCGTTT